MKRDKSINYNTLKYIKDVIPPQVEIVDLKVQNKWLVAYLSSGVNFMALNNPFIK